MELIDKIKASQQEYFKYQQEVREFVKNKDNSLHDRLKYAKELPELLKKEEWFSGIGNMSLYDEFHWERHETRDLGELLDMFMEDICNFLNIEWDQLDLHKVASFLEEPKDSLGVIINHMLDSGYSSLTYDW